MRSLESSLLSTPTLLFFSNYKNVYMNYIFSLNEKKINFLYGSICAIRKSAFLPWPVTLNFGEDTEYGMELTRKGKND